ncbi:MAG: PP2C family serine/threonine-protein phosphatase [Acutalibacteraceae bacterium]|nr:PP2C family serine/threonine-protein phosphatase [Acutalibacteraceae bacterium]
MDFIISAANDIGTTKKTNQDSFIAKVINTKIGKIAFAVLCDGMGGLAKGEVASSTLVNAFDNWSKTRLPLLCEAPINDYDISNEWSKIAIDYNEKIKTYGKRCGVSLGTTVTGIMLTSERFYIINVGDTRAYEISANAVQVLTKDQTVVAREVELGNITPEQAKVDPRRSVLLQCVGASDVVYPDIFVGNTNKNSVYMLCSDGFRHEISEAEIFQYMNPAQMTDAVTGKKNMETLIELNKQRQERDNITVVSIRTF